MSSDNNPYDLDTYSVRETRENISAVISAVDGTKQRVLVTKHRRPVMACVPVEDIATLERLDAESLKQFADQHAHTDSVAETGARAHDLIGSLPQTLGEMNGDRISRDDLQALHNEISSLRSIIETLASKIDRNETESDTWSTRPISMKAAQSNVFMSPGGHVESGLGQLAAAIQGNLSYMLFRTDGLSTETCTSIAQLLDQADADADTSSST